MMKLVNVEIVKYKSYISSHNVEIHNGITTLVGKNESGKTAFLEALAKVNYFEDDESFKLDEIIDYPRREYIRYKKNRENDKCVTLQYELSKEMIDLINAEIGEDILQGNRFSYTLNYHNKNLVDAPKVNRTLFVERLLDKYEVDLEEREVVGTIKTIRDLLNIELEVLGESVQEKFRGIQDYLNNSFMLKVNSDWDNLLQSYIYRVYLQPQMPKFWYYDEYYELPSRININHMKSGNINGNLTKDTLKTSRALFEMAGIDIDELINASSFESFLAELEATSNAISDEIFEYWSTNNNDLEIKFEIETPQNTNEKVLDIRVKNNKHRVTLPLKSRSKGFNWFFSFIVWFSKIQSETDNFILLLDEPGLNLHASAQNDLLRFIEDLSQKYQIIYTTHSPFMIDSNKLDRVRTVYDTENGTCISDVIQEKDPDTLFPLQAALGYDIAQNLFVSKKNLLVEGPADLIIINAMSSYLESINREKLNEDITIVPVGGLDRVASFISLLRGSKLNIVCLLDSFTNSKGKQKLENLIVSKVIKEKNIIFFDQFTTYDKSDIEDLFTKKEYVMLYNRAFPETSINHLEFDDKPILSQISKVIGKKRFNHFLPAKQLLHVDDLSDVISNDTLKKFEEMFIYINKLF